jgi:hypothetical protein
VMSERTASGITTLRVMARTDPDGRALGSCSPSCR